MYYDRITADNFPEISHGTIPPARVIISRIQIRHESFKLLDNDFWTITISKDLSSKQMFEIAGYFNDNSIYNWVIGAYVSAFENQEDAIIFKMLI